MIVCVIFVEFMSDIMLFCNGLFDGVLRLIILYLCYVFLFYRLIKNRMMVSKIMNMFLDFFERY